MNTHTHQKSVEYLAVKRNDGNKMWLEVKGMFTFIALSMFAFAIAFTLYTNFLVAFFIFLGIFFVVLGDLMLGWKITAYHLLPLLDPLPPNSELCVYLDFSGNVDFIVSKKDKEGTRRFVKYKKDATIINDGKYQIRTINGNHGFIGHEDYIFSVNVPKAKALEKAEGDDIKEIYENRGHVTNG